MTGSELLATWLKANGVTRARFAKQIFRSAATVENILAGRSTPNDDTAATIDAETDGAVPAHVWRPQEPTDSGLCGHSHAEIAAELGITRQAVAAIEKQALRKLRRYPELHKLWIESHGIEVGWAEFA